MKTETAFGLAVLLIPAFFLAQRYQNARSLPSDFRDAPNDNATGQLKDANPAGVTGDVKIPNVQGYATAEESPLPIDDVPPPAPTVTGMEPAVPIEWVTINGGKFKMGTATIKDAKPIHEVAINTFDMSKTAVTVEQYAECVNKGRCTEPAIDYYCNWGVAGRELHPVNCVDWEQANQYAKFRGARLPSEAEWEYAATSGGKNWKYPWGNDEPTCDKAVMYGNGDYGCGKKSTWPVCSKPAGNTAQGLCDMAGNVWQWVQDNYEHSYKGAPVDGSAFEDAGSKRVIRGSCHYSGAGDSLRTDNWSRYGRRPGNRLNAIGFRIAR